MYRLQKWWCRLEPYACANSDSHPQANTLRDLGINSTSSAALNSTLLQHFSSMQKSWDSMIAVFDDHGTMVFDMMYRGAGGRLSEQRQMREPALITASTASFCKRFGSRIIASAQRVTALVKRH